MKIAAVSLTSSLFIVCLALGCGTEDTVDENEGVVQPSEEALDEMMSAYCEFAIRCVDETGVGEGEGIRYCHPAAQDAFTQTLLDQAGDESHLDTPSLIGCREAIEAESSCLADPFDSLACQQIVVGTVLQGETCQSSFACEGDSYCAIGEGTSCGVCQSRAQEGDSCADADCSALLYCGAEQTCQPVGQRSDLCTVDEACEPGLRCLSGRCGVPSAPFGSSCSAGDPCNDNLFCETSGTNAGTCQRAAESGAACDDNLPCGNRGNRCLDGVCTPIAAPGESCTSSDACPSGFGCISRSCQALPVDGEPCDASGCFEVMCLGGTCGLLPIRDRCETNADCESGNCSDRSRTCEDAVRRGGDCAVLPCEAGLECLTTTDDEGAIQSRCDVVVCD